MVSERGSRQEWQRCRGDVLAWWRRYLPVRIHVLDQPTAPAMWDIKYSSSDKEIRRACRWCHRSNIAPRPHNLLASRLRAGRTRFWGFTTSRKAVGTDRNGASLPYGREVLAHVQGESLKANAAVFARFVNSRSPASAGDRSRRAEGVDHHDFRQAQAQTSSDCGSGLAHAGSHAPTAPALAHHVSRADPFGPRPSTGHGADLEPTRSLYPPGHCTVWTPLRKGTVALNAAARSASKRPPRSLATASGLPLKEEQRK
jgi:hypothetical protein